MVKQFANGFVFVSLILFSACQSNLSPQSVRAEPREGSVVAETGDRSPLKLPLAKPKIVVKKRKRQMLFISEGKLLRPYRIGLGSTPRGDKVLEGNQRTTEGQF